MGRGRSGRPLRQAEAKKEAADRSREADPSGAAPTTRTARVAASFATICAVTLLAYARSFDSPFQFDDYGHIVGNPVMA